MEIPPAQTHWNNLTPAGISSVPQQKSAAQPMEKKKKNKIHVQSRHRTELQLDFLKISSRAPAWQLLPHLTVPVL